MSNEQTPAQRAAESLSSWMKSNDVLNLTDRRWELLREIFRQRIEAEYSAEQRIAEAAKAYVEAMNSPRTFAGLNKRDETFAALRATVQGEKNECKHL